MNWRWPFTSGSTLQKSDSAPQENTLNRRNFCSWWSKAHLLDSLSGLRSLFFSRSHSLGTTPITATPHRPFFTPNLNRTNLSQITAPLSPHSACSAEEWKVGVAFTVSPQHMNSLRRVPSFLGIPAPLVFSTVLGI